MESEARPRTVREDQKPLPNHGLLSAPVRSSMFAQIKNRAYTTDF